MENNDTKVRRGDAPSKNIFGKYIFVKCIFDKTLFNNIYVKTIYYVLKIYLLKRKTTVQKLGGGRLLLKTYLFLFLSFQKSQPLVLSQNLLCLFLFSDDFLGGIQQIKCNGKSKTKVTLKYDAY